MMTTRLADVMEAEQLSDARLAAESGLLRGQIYAYRVGDKVPTYDNGVKIIKALKKRGITVEVAELCSRLKRGKRARAA